MSREVEEPLLLFEAGLLSASPLAAAILLLRSAFSAAEEVEEEEVDAAEIDEAVERDPSSASGIILLYRPPTGGATPPESWFSPPRGWMTRLPASWVFQESALNDRSPTRGRRWMRSPPFLLLLLSLQAPRRIARWSCSSNVSACCSLSAACPSRTAPLPGQVLYWSRCRRLWSRSSQVNYVLLSLLLRNLPARGEHDQYSGLGLGASPFLQPIHRSSFTRAR